MIFYDFYVIRSVELALVSPGVKLKSATVIVKWEFTNLCLVKDFLYLTLIRSLERASVACFEISIET